nr:tetratricopeptide repeat protein [Pseudohoeflea sp. DP4N28-3]
MMAGAASGPAAAFDPDSGVTRESNPLALFKFGFSAYRKGKKDDAVEAYRYAAEKGHRGARWALANMYAYGDGVTENDYEAFKIYDEIARQGVEPGSADTGYFINALISLANYYQNGIPDSPVKPDLGAARQLYFQAASAFGVPEAQFRLGRMILEGQGGANSAQQAKKWLNRARMNGHAGAAAMLGHVIFQEGESVRGLAFMTAALERSEPQDKVWIRSMQEEAFSLAGEADRRTAVALAQDMLAKGLN